MGKKFMGYDNASELITAIGNKIKAKYTKPNTGIPKRDLATAVQTSLGKADSAVQPSAMTEALAAKQNSLSETQLAAVNSGINSTKVGQISTNQSNILYAINTGVKNIAFLQNGTYKSASGGSETTFVVENGVVTVTSTTADTRATIMNYVTLEPGTYIITNRQEDGRDVRLRYNGVDYNDTFTINSATTFEVRAYSYKILTNATITPLLCIKSVYDQDSSYQPPALPNYDLTRLEAEDRAALAEEIDAGAKNLLSLSTVVSSGSVWNPIQPIPAGTYIVSGKFSTTSAGAIAFNFYNSSGQEVGVYEGTTTPVTQGATITLTGTATQVKFWTQINNVTISDWMICTKAAFDVSQKFVPFAKSNYELTQYTDGCSLDTVSKSSGSLNDITQNSFAVYNVSVTGKPIDSAGNTSAFTGICKTDVYNSSEAMQKLTRLSNGHNWVRTKTAGNWNAWIKQGVAPYFINSNSASITNLLYDAAVACGLSPTDKIHSGIISVTTNTAGESLLVFFTYKHGVYADAQSITNKVISFAGTINNLGTFAVSGGTAPYNFNVMFFI